MIAVVGRRPLLTTDVAELILTSTRYVVAALILLDNCLALLALSVVKVVLEEEHLLIIALPRMRGQQTARTELAAALVAQHHLVARLLDHSLALLLRTQFGVRVLAHHLKL